MIVIVKVLKCWQTLADMSMSRMSRLSEKWYSSTAHDSCQQNCFDRCPSTRMCFGSIRTTGETSWPDRTLVRTFGPWCRTRGFRLPAGWCWKLGRWEDAVKSLNVNMRCNSLFGRNIQAWILDKSECSCNMVWYNLTMKFYVFQTWSFL